MKENLDDVKFDLSCTQCGRKFSKTVGWLKKNSQHTCTHCKTVVTLDKEQFLREIASAEAEHAKMVKKLKKTFNIKL